MLFIKKGTRDPANNKDTTRTRVFWKTSRSIVDMFFLDSMCTVTTFGSINPGWFTSSFVIANSISDCWYNLERVPFLISSNASIRNTCEIVGSPFSSDNRAREYRKPTLSVILRERASLSVGNFAVESCSAMHTISGGNTKYLSLLYMS